MKSIEVINNFKLNNIKWLSLKINSLKATENFYGITSNILESEKIGIE